MNLRSSNKQCIFVFDYRWLFPGTENLAYVHCNLRFFDSFMYAIKLNYFAPEVYIDTAYNVLFCMVNINTQRHKKRYPGIDIFKKVVILSTLLSVVCE